MTLREFERWLALEILGKYHHRFHSALKGPPLAVWSELAVSNPPRMPRDRTEFLAGLLPYELRLRRRDGFHLFNFRYWSDALVTLLGRHERWAPPSRRQTSSWPENRDWPDPAITGPAFSVTIAAPSRRRCPDRSGRATSLCSATAASFESVVRGLIQSRMASAWANS
jgi:hypothetical protein